ncbi:MAG TPA: hypothetical protein PLZ51_16820, partial [Aggregatilineales bacterium]|nr:hypothetical protein [Aggregatilineales bacterium]
MKMIIIIGIMMMVLVGCDVSPEENTALRVTLTDIATTVAEVTVPTVDFSIDGIHLALPHPQEWESYTTEYGIVLAEQLGSVATEGQLGGILIHLFVPPLDGVTLPISDDSNRALSILTQILTHPDYVGDATV